MKLVFKKIFLASLIGAFFVGSAWADIKKHELGFYVMPGTYSASPRYTHFDGNCRSGYGVDMYQLEYYRAKGASYERGKTSSIFNTAGGLYYSYANKGGFGYRLDISSMAFVPAKKYNFATGYEQTLPASGGPWGFPFFLQMDNTVFYDFTSKDSENVKFDLGLGARLYFGGTFIQPVFYYDLDVMIPNTGVHFNFTGNIGTVDIHNSDVKLSAAYEFGAGSSNILYGVELGYKYFGYSHISLTYEDFHQKALGMNTAFVAMYIKM